MIETSGKYGRHKNKSRLIMSNTSVSNSTMSTTVSSKPTKAVARKPKATEEPVSVPAPAPVSAPVSTSSPAPVKKAKKASADASASGSAPVSAPVEAPVAPVSTVTSSTVPDASAPVAEVSLDQSAEALRAELQQVRNSVSQALKALEALMKSHRREVRDAKGRGRRKNAQNSTGEKRKTIFTTPVKLREPLATLLGKSSGFEMSPSEVTHHVNDYMKEHNLKTTHLKADGKKEPHFRADQALARTLGLTAGQEYPSKELQGLLYKQYDMPPKASQASASA